MANTQVDSAVKEMESCLAALSGAEGFAEALAEAGARLGTLADRLAHPEGPLAAALCGPTGAGKSHLLNFLAGGPVSPSSYRRPSTAAPVLAA
ncbi:MAG: hypothetical protein LBV79_11570, partial [Candidatus Adiutrix sp.]|nr:hypothetical protein [Candidatus Adiutrix sp.]